MVSREKPFVKTRVGVLLLYSHNGAVLMPRVASNEVSYGHRRGAFNSLKKQEDAKVKTRLSTSSL